MAALPASNPVETNVRVLRIARRSIRVTPPAPTDPRLHVATVIVAVQVLGQTSLGFDLSIAQILVAIGTCAVLEVVITARRSRILLWPSSAMLTGNGVALILRVPGTEHGDWWSLHGAGTFAAVAALALLSKYAIRWRDRPVFNPSNIGLVVGFLILGPLHADPQDLWWGPLGPALLAVMTIIVVGGILIIRRVQLLTVAAAFFVTFAVGIGILAAAGHEMTARWHIGPVAGIEYWTVLVFSPEVLVFLFFMITDPRTVLVGRVGHMVHGSLVALVATVLVAMQRTEFATKVAILAALALVCAAHPVIQARLPVPGSADDRLGSWWRRILRADSTGSAVLRSILGVLVTGGLFVAIQAPVDVPQPTALPTTERPGLDLSEEAVPPVQRGDIAPTPGLDSTAASVRKMGRDLIEDLMIEQLALQQGDPELAATATVGPRLAALRESISSGQAATIVEYDIRSLRLLLQRDSNNPQATPKLALRAQGTTRAVGSDGDAGENPQPFEETFVLEQVGNHFLIAEPAPNDQ